MSRYIASCSFGKDIDNMPTIDAVPIPETGIGDVSDGYHTFNELYHHRAVLFSVICNDRATLSWKSKLHNDETMYDGMFIVGIDTPNGQASYHYDIEPYWDMFRVQELERAPEWDGHTPEQAIERICKLESVDAVPVVHGRWMHEKDRDRTWCSVCSVNCCTNYDEAIEVMHHCPHCGARMDGDA